jgi:protein TonB
MKKISTLVFVIPLFSFQSYCQHTNSPDSANIKQDSLKQADKNMVLTKVEGESQPADKSSWQNFLKKNINYDIAAFNEAPVGKYSVRVRFTIFEDGHLGDFTPLTNFGYGMEREVIHALKKSPDWIPAFQNGKNVKAIRVQTITFVVE